MDEDEIFDELKNTIYKKYRLLSDLGDAVKSSIVDGEYKTIHKTKSETSGWTRVVTLVTKTPDERLFQWWYLEGEMGLHEDVPPKDFNKTRLIEVIETEKLITVYTPK